MSTKNIIFIVIAFAFVLLIVWAGSNSANIPSAADTSVSASSTSSAGGQTVTKVESATEVSSTKATAVAVMTTNKGTINLELYGKDSPKTVANFIKLANEGFYNGTRFHRVIKDFMIQGGDPNSKDVSKQSTWGQGGPGYTIPDEFNPTAALYKTGYTRGTLAMANTGALNSGGSQFFIMHQDYPLPPSYTIFGKVTSGIETVDAIANVKTVNPAQHDDRPIDDVIIEKIEIK